MRSPLPRPDVDQALRGLKDFQRETVEYVFRRLYTDQNRTHRFLIADEVGLGKTLVARGVIARAIDHLWDDVERIDIIYICSNADIARQNINRLSAGMPGLNNLALASRITLLPTVLHDLKNSKVNLVSLTPGTSFDLRSSLGTAEERALLYWLLREVWDLHGTGPLNLLRGHTGKDNFRRLVKGFKGSRTIEASVAAEFVRGLERHIEAEAREGRESLRSRFLELCHRFHWVRKHIPPRDAQDRGRVVGELRALLAATCIEALEPDLVILDEFQRFKHLLAGEDEASQLARELFDYSDEVSSARVLLLSATPYKMYTLSDESGEDDHYQDFMNTLRFLLDEDADSEQLEGLLRRYRRELYRLGDDEDSAMTSLREVKRELEGRLRRVVVRTERLAASEDRSGMLVEVPAKSTRLESRELRAFVALQRVAHFLEQGDVLEYWKAAPYLLNFMDDYQLKRALEQVLSGPQRDALLDRLGATEPGLLFPWRDWRSYAEIDPGNARLRGLLADTVGVGAWRLVWIPPSLPHYLLGGPFADPLLQGFTKRLIFSAWRVVPKVLAAFLSYDAERRMMRLLDEEAENTPEARRRHRPLLRFTRTEGRLTGMPVLGLIYPSTVLAREADPLVFAGKMHEADGGNPEGPPTLSELHARVQGRIEELLAELTVEVRSGPPDESWYWAAPILLDLHFAGDDAHEWLLRPALATVWSGGSEDAGEEGGESNWSEHVAFARALAEGQLQLGPMPAELPHVLTQMAIAGPGVAALRALSRLADRRSNGANPALVVRDSAAQVAWAFRGLFNLPGVMALIRGMSGEEPYWRRVLEYCVDGGLQAVLDEYAHVLQESLGLMDKPVEEVATGIAEAMHGALSLRAVTLRADDIPLDPSASHSPLPSMGMRARFALRFGDERSEDANTVTRSAHVRDAFNSPFWPFVLATTSIGQEGLDFHLYCHAVVHWDLPSNPVDLEQREGRVHRYKGHAVRKNVARQYRALALSNAAKEKGGVDPWASLFDFAVRDRPQGLSDLVPFWVYPLDEGARIERHVPALPLSSERDRLVALRRSLAVYRMVFGQPRQEDLLAYLLERLPESDARRVSDQLKIDLGPVSAHADEH